MIQLLDLSEKTLNAVKSLENDAISGIDVTSHEQILFFEVFNSQIESLESVISLLKDGKYKDCFILLRSVFETYLFLRLMVEGKKYKETRDYNILPSSGSSQKEARDKTFEKWQSDKTSRPDIVAINKGKQEDIIKITYEGEGLYDKTDVEEKGEMVTKYYFAFMEYDPETHFLAALPTISAGDMFPDIGLKQQQIHKKLHHYFHIDSIIRNLELNRLITAEQKDRIIVHYNFLSMFTHPGKRGLDKIKNVLNYSSPSKGENILDELILLYICSIQNMLLSPLLQYFKDKNKGDWYVPYEKSIADLDIATKDFWFIFNEPTDFDIKESDTKKKWIEWDGKSVDKDVVIYYTDPIERVRKIRS